jgi:hypothetical protein
VTVIGSAAPSLLNALIIGEPCKVVANSGRRYSGEFGGIETIHGEWSVLVRTGNATHSVPVGRLRYASGPPGSARVASGPAAR